jgi:hypothetical protein
MASSLEIIAIAYSATFGVMAIVTALCGLVLKVKPSSQIALLASVVVAMLSCAVCALIPLKSGIYYREDAFEIEYVSFVVAMILSSLLLITGTQRREAPSGRAVILVGIMWLMQTTASLQAHMDNFSLRFFLTMLWKLPFANTDFIPYTKFYFVLLLVVFFTVVAIFLWICFVALFAALYVILPIIPKSPFLFRYRNEEPQAFWMCVISDSIVLSYHAAYHLLLPSQWSLLLRFMILMHGNLLSLAAFLLIPVFLQRAPESNKTK